jgi:hypothetical protein
MRGVAMKKYTCETCGWTGDYPAYRHSSVEDGLEWAVCPMDCVYETCGGAIDEVLVRVNPESPLGHGLERKGMIAHIQKGNSHWQVWHDLRLIAEFDRGEEAEAFCSSNGFLWIVRS